MKVIVCIKQVPDSSEVKINKETNTLIRQGIPTMINPFDMHALEAGITMKEQMKAKVTVVTMGPPQAESSLREAIAMGADEAVLITDRAFAGADTLATSFTLSKAIQILGFDIILCGKQTIEGDTAQVGPEVAEMLNIPHIPYVKKIEELTDSHIKAHRLMEDGYDCIESPMPVLLTVVRELNQPRLPSLRGKMAAKKTVIKKLTSEDLDIEPNRIGLLGSPTKVQTIFYPSHSKSDRQMFEGTPEEQVENLLVALKSMRCI